MMMRAELTRTAPPGRVVKSIWPFDHAHVQIVKTDNNLLPT
jgi:hypothetical protein